MRKQPDCPSALYAGTRKLGKCQEFEKFISHKVTI
ncbi:MAG: excisionase [Oscillospiraceae bacterium]